MSKLSKIMSKFHKFISEIINPGLKILQTGLFLKKYGPKTSKIEVFVLIKRVKSSCLESLRESQNY